ncbi:phytoene desaturase family protein [Marinitoga litoralis]|uniref:phytoene desaturase family protein n=1 Tax=Marinitoga litoralis TaxID=570855 RepID=UPI001960398C|nr:NAD(P)/FAD-dependent oxidoreductase [Marinitoga litoralis]MBM7559574.1 phytoene dehydrogenase-like protein [Marinitoga litoralis]
MKVIIVGGGISGLTAACFAKGDVLLIEKNNKCGGLVNTFSRDGFKFEGGVRALLNSGIIFPMLEKLNIELETLPNNVSIGIEDKIIHIKDKNSILDYELMLKELYPENSDEISNLIKIIKKTMDNLEILYSVKNPLFANKKDYINYLPWLFKAIKVFTAMKNMNEPIEEFLKERISNNSLIDIIDQHFFKYLPSFFALSYFYIYSDYFYPKGGVGVLAEKLENKFLENNGEILYNTEIISIDVNKRYVIDQNGEKYYYDKLIWAADLKKLYNMVYINNNKFIAEKEKILSAEPAESVYTIYIAVDEPPETFAKISHGHFFYTPSKKGLGEIHRSELEKLIQNGSKQEIIEWIENFGKYNTYEISIPVLKDPDAAPKGKTGLIISTLFDYRLIKKVYDEGWYDEFKGYMEKHFIETLSKSIYPALKDKIIFKFSATPLTIENYADTYNGSIIGWSFKDKLPIVNSLSKSALTSIPNVYKAGKWAYSPSGVPMAILTGKIAADKI